MNKNNEILLNPNCEVELNENFLKNENKFHRISLQLNSLRLLEKATIILVAIPYTFCNGSMLILFPYLFIFYISEEDAENIFALLLILIYNGAYLVGSILNPTPCFGERYGWSFALNALSILFFLMTIFMNLLYFHNMTLNEGEFGRFLWVFLPTLGSLMAGFASYNLCHLHYIYLINCINTYNREPVLTLFYKIASFGMAFGAISSFFFHLNFLIILGVFLLISVIIFLFIKNPDLVFKEYITNLYKDYKLKELVSKKPNIDDKQSLETISELQNCQFREPSISKFTAGEDIFEEEMKASYFPSFSVRFQKHIRKRSSLRDIHTHIFKRDMRFLTALSSLEALISSYLVLIIPSTIVKMGNELELTLNEIFYRFSICFIVIGISQTTTLFIKKFNYLEDPTFSCHEILKAFSFLIVMYAFAYFFNIYPLLLIASCFLGYCHFLTVLVIENQIFLNFEHLSLFIGSVHTANCLIKGLIFVIGLIFIDTNPINSLIIYVILVFIIWCLNKK